jgi:hypothetical protein
VADPLVCPGCGEVFGDDERFCPRCNLPLVLVDTSAPPPDERRERARKIKPQYTEGELVAVAFPRHQAEAELIQGLLLEEGIPSILRRTGGFDVPDFLAAGPREVLVARSAVEAARDLLDGGASDGGELGEV